MQAKRKTHAQLDGMYVSKMHLYIKCIIMALESIYFFFSSFFFCASYSFIFVVHKRNLYTTCAPVYVNLSAACKRLKHVRAKNNISKRGNIFVHKKGMNIVYKTILLRNHFFFLYTRAHAMRGKQAGAYTLCMCMHAYTI